MQRHPNRLAIRLCQWEIGLTAVLVEEEGCHCQDCKSWEDAGKEEHGPFSHSESEPLS